MKKTITLLLVLSMAFGMAACNAKSEADTETTGVVETEIATETTGVAENETVTETTGSVEAFTEAIVSVDGGDHQIPATVCMPNTEG